MYKNTLLIFPLKVHESIFSYKSRKTQKITVQILKLYFPFLLNIESAKVDDMRVGYLFNLFPNLTTDCCFSYVM